MAVRPEAARVGGTISSAAVGTVERASGSWDGERRKQPPLHVVDTPLRLTPPCQHHADDSGA
jgi:hypothetical protein